MLPQVSHGLALLVIFSADKLRSNTHLEMVRTRRMFLGMIGCLFFPLSNDHVENDICNCALDSSIGVGGALV